MATVGAAVSRIQDNLKQTWNDWDVSAQDLRSNTQTIKNLKPSERNQAIGQLSDDELQHWAAETTGAIGPLPADERRDLLNTLATSLDGKQSARVANAFGPQDMAGAVATHGTARQKQEFIAAMQDKANDGMQTHPAFGSTAMTHGNAQAHAIAHVLGSMQDQPQALSQAIEGLDKAGKLDDVLRAASGMRTTSIHSEQPTVLVSFSEKPLTDILAGVNNLPKDDPARAPAFRASMDVLQEMQTGIGGGKQGANAQSVQNVADAMGKIFSRQEAIDQGLWQPPPNPDPASISLDRNIAASHQNSGDAAWFYNQVKSGGPMDYKAGNGNMAKAEDYENFGNFNFGVAAAAYGFPEEVAKAGAGAYQLYSGTSEGAEWISSYFDDPRDTAQIAAGYDYYHSGMWRVWSGD